MRKVAILTDFRGYDVAYGLCQFVRNEIKLLTRNGYTPRLILRAGYKEDVCQEAYAGAELVSIAPGQTGSNKVRVDGNSDQDIERIHNQMREVLDGVGLVITHDLIFQANLWKYHVAARRYAKERPDLQWLNVVHSSSVLGTAEKAGPFKNELAGKFPNSRLWVFSREHITRYGGLYGYEIDEIVVLPPPLDFLEDMDLLSRHIIQDHDLMRADIIIVYPCRLDRGKQPGVVIEIAAELRDMHHDARVVLVNSYSNAGDKKIFREELRKQAKARDVPLVLTSDYDEFRVRVPHQVVMDLLELGDILIQPSTTESYSRVLCEAAWKGCGMMLNFDLPMFREYDGLAMFGKFSSTVDVLTGGAGETSTQYADRAGYMRHLAANIAYWMENYPMLKMHALMRKERSLEALWPKLQAVIERD